MTDANVQEAPDLEVDLDIQGMTCASCAVRIEKRLNKLDGVQASVNYATESARITSHGHDVDELIEQVRSAGYSASLPAEVKPVDESERLARTLKVSAALSLPVIVLAMSPALQFPGWQWVSFVLATPVVFWGGWRFHRAAWMNAKHLTTTMDTLISVGSLAGYLWSAYALIFGHAGMLGMKHAFELRLHRNDGLGNIYFEAACGIITFILAGRYLEARSKRQAGAALEALLSLGAREVSVIRGGVESRIPVEQLLVGDEFLVRPGEKVATDGRVLVGQSAVDASLVTGESVPASVGPGDDVIGATLNTDGLLQVEATRVGADTQLAQIAKLVSEAQSGKAAVQRLADRVSAVFVPVVIVLAIITAVVWLILGAGAGFAVNTAVAVLIIACPCALGLATPTALLVGTGRGAQLGLLIKGPETLENTQDIDTVVLDKTGTITTGQMSVVGVRPVLRHDESNVLRWAAAAETGSEHPIGKAILAYAVETGAVASGEGQLVPDHFANQPGQGVRAWLGEHQIDVGRHVMLDADRTALAAQSQTRGRTTIPVAVDGELLGLIELADTVKPTSAEAVQQLRALGLQPVLLTGDNQAVANAVAAEVGIDTVIAEVMPADKVAQVRRLQDEGRRVAMVGDGVNDAAALAAADLGIAMGTGADVAIEASDLTLIRGDLRGAADAIRLARATLRTIKSNLFWAFAYNVAALPIAALGFLNPMLAGAAMAFSSVFVVTNSLRLRGFRAYH